MTGPLISSVYKTEKVAVVHGFADFHTWSVGPDVFVVMMRVMVNEGDHLGLTGRQETGEGLALTKMVPIS